ALQIIKIIREKGIKTEMYPDAAKIDKQFKHAERKGIPFVVKEITGQHLMVKNIATGEQQQLTLDALLQM
ncbi:MAG: histidine--tRNA ligase, partial [Bacteroidia bacterium]|nr:histidine--tRNA ligase [Bacteroidia bacterium]